MKTVHTIRTQLACLCVAACCVVYLCACKPDRPQRDAPRENESRAPGQPGDRLATEDAQAVWERAQFEKSMRETADTFSREMQALKAAAAQLSAPEQEEGAQMVAELEEMLAGFRAQIAAMEKAEGIQWADYQKAVLGSSLEVKGHLNRAAERVAPEEAQAEAGSQ
jgi:hypothetical protein